MSQKLQLFVDQEKLYRTEGRRGVENLCTMAAAIGYKDPQRWGQFSQKASMGDLLMFLEDNPGAIEAISNWMDEQTSPEWDAELDKVLIVHEEEAA